MGNAFNAFAIPAATFQFVTAPLIPWYVQGQVPLHGTLAVMPGNPVLPFKEGAVALGLQLSPGLGLTVGFLIGLWAPGSRTWDFGLFCPPNPPELAANRIASPLSGRARSTGRRTSLPQMLALHRAMQRGEDVEAGALYAPGSVPPETAALTLAAYRKALAAGREARARYLAIAAKGKGPWKQKVDLGEPEPAAAAAPAVEPEPPAPAVEPERGKRKR